MIPKFDSLRLHTSEYLKIQLNTAEGFNDQEDRDQFLYHLSLSLEREWLLEAAEQVTNNITNWTIEKAELLLHIAQRWLKLGQTPKAASLAARIRDLLLARKESFTWQGGSVLNKLALFLLDLQNQTLAAAVWQDAISFTIPGLSNESQQDRVDASSVLADIAEALAENCYPAVAMETLQQIPINYLHKRTQLRVDLITAYMRLRKPRTSIN